MPRIQRRLSRTDADIGALAAAYPDAMGAPASAMTPVLDTLDGHPVGIGGWLSDRGVDRAAVDAWKARLLTDRAARPRDTGHPADQVDHDEGEGDDDALVGGPAHAARSADAAAGQEHACPRWRRARCVP